MSTYVHPVTSGSVSDDSDPPESHEKSVGVDIRENEKAGIEKSSGDWAPPEEWLERFKAEYSSQRDGGSQEALPPGSDPDRVAEAIFTMSVSQSVECLKSIVVEQAQDYSFDTALMRRCKDLVSGHEACAMEPGEWDYQVCRTAGLIHNWSPYTEVRAVTLPYDDPEETCESFRAWFLGMFWVVVCTGVNTCESADTPLTSVVCTQGIWTSVLIAATSLQSSSARHLHSSRRSATAPRTHGQSSFMGRSPLSH